MKVGVSVGGRQLRDSAGGTKSKGGSASIKFTTNTAAYQTSSLITKDLVFQHRG